MFTKKRVALVILLILCLIETTHAATLHGTIYAWSDFEKPLENTVVEINSTPVQYIVSTTGTYSFNLSPGIYTVKAKYYHNNILEYSTEENIQIDTEGDFIHDLLLFPPTDDEFEFLAEINITSDIVDEDLQDNKIYYIIFIGTMSTGLIIYYRYKKKRTGIKIKKDVEYPSEILSETKEKEIPEDIKELYDMILKMGGIVTQKELRKKMPYSEAKVSLMITDLEDRGMVRKIKKGRSNVIIAEAKK